MILSNIKNPFLKRKIFKIYNDVFKEVNVENFDIDLTLNYVSKEEIKELNKQYRNVDKVTDVLSFPMLEIKAGQNLNEFQDEVFNEEGKAEGKKTIMLGSIFICKEKAKEQAKEYGHSFERECIFLALHGVLHLLGYDHIKKEDAEIMEAKQKDILERHGVKR